MKLNIFVSTAGWCAITKDFVQKSFKNTGFWPMDYQFLKMGGNGEHVQKCKMDFEGEPKVEETDNDPLLSKNCAWPYIMGRPLKKSIP